MKTNIFFGDSISAGENCDTFDSFVYKLGSSFMDVDNRAISGTTIGEYSIYPVDGQSLSCLYPQVHDLNYYSNIYLEYGVNDVSAIMCGFTTMQSVIVSFVKAIDGIRQMNSHAKIRFLAVSSDRDIIKKHSMLQCEYLKNDYFKGYSFNFPVSLCTQYYEQIIHAVSKRVEVIPMIENIHFFDESEGCIGSDGLHPNAKGHKLIAENIKKYL